MLLDFMYLLGWSCMVHGLSRHSFMPRFPHRGTNNPSRLFFASLFDARSHAEAISVDCISLQDKDLNQKYRRNR